MEKPQNHYWGVVSNAQRSTPLFTGTFTECWKWLVKEFASTTLKDLETAGIRISRI